MVMETLYMKVQKLDLNELVAAFVGRTLADVEDLLIGATLRSCEGNRRKAALMLGINERTLRNRIRKIDGIPEGDDDAP
jgi:DNA-binding protein Fis